MKNILITRKYGFVSQDDYLEFLQGIQDKCALNMDCYILLKGRLQKKNANALFSINLRCNVAFHVLWTSSFITLYKTDNIADYAVIQSILNSITYSVMLFPRGTDIYAIFSRRIFWPERFPDFINAAVADSGAINIDNMEDEIPGILLARFGHKYIDVFSTDNIKKHEIS